MRRIRPLACLAFSLAIAFGPSGCAEMEALRRINAELESDNARLRRENQDWSDRYYEANRLRTEETNELTARVESLQREVDQAKGERTSNERRLEADARRLSLEVDAANENVRALRQQFQADLDRANEALSRAGRDSKTFQEEIDGLKKAREIDADTIASLNAALEEQHQALAVLERRESELAEQARQAELARNAAEGGREEVRRQVEAAQKKIDDANREIVDLKAQLAAASGDASALAEMERQRQEWEREKGELEGEVERLNQRLDAAATTSATLTAAPAGPDPILEALAEAARRIAANAGAEAEIDVQIDARGLRVIIPSDLAFDRGSLILTENVKPVLVDLAGALNRIAPGRLVRVEGHTDDEPARSLPFPDNWGVGSTRAVNVGRFMVLDGGMSPDRLELATRSFHDPRAEGRTVAARARNRRVEIVVPPIAPR